MNTLIAKKVGMTQIFDENAKAMGVTVLDVSDCRVVQVKNEKSMATMQYNLLLEQLRSLTIL